MKHYAILLLLALVAEPLVAQHIITRDSKNTTVSITGQFLENREATGIAISVNCFKVPHLCIESRAWKQSGEALPALVTNFLNIVSWDDNGVIATTRPPCDFMAERLTVDFGDNKVTITQSSQQRCKIKDVLGGNTYIVAPK